MGKEPPNTEERKTNASLVVLIHPLVGLFFGPKLVTFKVVSCVSTGIGSVECIPTHIGTTHHVHPSGLLPRPVLWWLVESRNSKKKKNSHAARFTGLVEERVSVREGKKVRGASSRGGSSTRSKTSPHTVPSPSAWLLLQRPSVVS